MAWNPSLPPSMAVNQVVKHRDMERAGANVTSSYQGTFIARGRPCFCWEQKILGLGMSTLQTA